MALGYLHTFTVGQYSIPSLCMWYWGEGMFIVYFMETGTGAGIYF